MRRPAPAGPVARACGVGAVFLLLYSLLGSQQYTAVDGALRCLDVFRHPVLTFAGNNHLLYPANVLGWHRLLGVSGAPAGDAFAFLRTTQLMNATAAAGALALLYWIVRTSTASEAAALTAAAGLGFSRAFLLHATNSAEPMVGLCWALVAAAAALVARRRQSVPVTVVAGVALALGIASYASMLLVAPAVLLLLHPGAGARRRVVILLISATLATVAIFGFAHASSGPTHPGGMTGHLFELPGISVWGGVSLSRAARLPLGFAQSVLPVLPSGYGGLRSLARTAAPLAIVWVAAVIAGIGALCCTLAWSAWRWRRQAERDALATPVAIAAGLAAALIAPLAWDPLYDKLWLLPTALAFLLGGLLAAATGGAARRSVIVGALVLVAVEATVNIARAIPAHRDRSPYLGPASVVARAVRPGDLLVLDWDPVSELYSGLWGADTTALVTLPTEAVLHGPAALVTLDSAVAATRRRGTAVFFVGVLDESPAAWDAFLGRRLHLPYAALDRYRDSSVVEARLSPPAATALTLRRLAAAGPEVAR